MKKFFVLLFLTAFGCHTATDNVLPGQPTSGDEHFISAERAIQIAQTAFSPVTFSNARGKAKKVKSQLTIEDADDSTKKTATQPVFYIVNYEEGGYSVISADDRLKPVLAIVEGGPSVSKGEDLPGGLLIWMKSTKDQIQNIRKVKLTKKIKKGGRTSTYLVGEKLPLLRTRWRQAGGKYDEGWPTYNRQIPWSCPGTDPNYGNGNALVGCVGLAVAQVVRYWGLQSPWFTTNY